MVFYFAYGSNMDEARMRIRNIYYTNVYSGILRGWKLVFNKIDETLNGAGYANIIKSFKDHVEGVIYETDSKSIEKLNKFEGVPKHYEKINLKVKDKNDNEIECIVYVANILMTKEGLKPRKEYLAHLLKGKFYLSVEYHKILSNVKTID
ncbi:MAG: gamma-glutamylcyclotransferase [Candidatus Nanoarchaeia archaeon]|nr:gamma-glutamylcyclotransferase [Candidatus Nanoarchaeia archaeon]MDD5239154.1 gamma-glutamylcyclotransferase [Candidatus Nanoarchaeia archaeon]